MLGIWTSKLLFPLKPQDYFLRIKYYFAVCCMAYLTNPLLLSNESFPVFAVINGSEINGYYYTLITIFLDKVLHVEFLDPKIKILKLWLCLDALVSRRPLLRYTSSSVEEIPVYSHPCWDWVVSFSQSSFHFWAVPWGGKQGWSYAPKSVLPWEWVSFGEVDQARVGALAEGADGWLVVVHGRERAGGSPQSI